MPAKSQGTDEAFYQPRVYGQHIPQCCSNNYNDTAVSTTDEQLSNIPTLAFDEAREETFETTEQMVPADDEVFDEDASTLIPHKHSNNWAPSMFTTALGLYLSSEPPALWEPWLSIFAPGFAFDTYFEGVAHHGACQRRREPVVAAEMSIVAQLHVLKTRRLELRPRWAGSPPRSAFDGEGPVSNITGGGVRVGSFSSFWMTHERYHRRLYRPSPREHTDGQGVTILKARPLVKPASASSVTRSSPLHASLGAYLG
ncbi:hypothetical protein KVT40_009262 [Elsinoe batatas]|uniref:Uncharacterized protein n=1 Tax=Elsinoe batatas TaxID=2601811 RepID=A0A8K0KVY2_9PEZI|nr:hypothetical protein KVT40_009262 [Elsinoe batatas]